MNSDASRAGIGRASILAMYPDDNVMEHAPPGRLRQQGSEPVGLMRKMMSVWTIGAVDFRSDKERTAAYTKAAKKQAKEQTRLMRQQAAHTRAMQQATQQPTSPAPAPPPQLPPAGWYPDQADASLVRWFDRTRWTEFTQPKS